ncbi:MAG: hypothetical protein ACLT2O_04335 [Dorea longicatena]|jgi:hypothetical protein
MVERNYELRKLCADDIFPMVNIISKIGIENMADCFDAKEMADIMNSVDSTLDEADGKESSDEADGKESSDNTMADVLTKQIGIKVIMKLVGLLLKNFGKIKRELYQFLAGLSGMTEKEIAALPLGTFTQMIVDVFKKEEFSDFFQVVSGLLK